MLDWLAWGVGALLLISLGCGIVTVVRVGQGNNDKTHSILLDEKIYERASAMMVAQAEEIARLSENLAIFQQEALEAKALLQTADLYIRRLRSKYNILDELPPDLKEWRQAKQEQERSERRLVRLRDRIATTYNLEELDTLAFDVGLSPDDIGGDTLQKRATELVRLARRRGLVDELGRVVGQQRPNS